MREYSLVITTTPSKKEAKELAKLILEKRFAACIQINKIDSFYYWEEKIEKSKEYRVLIKTKSAIFEKLKIFIEENHSYDTPQIVEIFIDDANSDYLEWIDDALK